MLVSYTLSILTIALSLTTRSQFAIECLRRSNQHFWSKTWGVTFGVDPWCWDLQRPNTPGWLNVKLFSKISNLCDHDTSTSRRDGRTGGRLALLAKLLISEQRCRLKTVSPATI